jgi:myo-inositol-1(or 4)-monophosphatase
MIPDRSRLVRTEKAMRSCVLDAGKTALRYFRNLEKSDIMQKSSIDLVTIADTEVEKHVQARLAKIFPDSAFIGEESGESGDINGPCFILDPIDGTTSFAHGYPFFSVSLAYREDRETYIGIVHAPAFGEIFTSIKGKGAFCGKRRMQVSGVSSLIGSLAITGFACIRAGQKPDNMALFEKVIYKLQGIRRDGSAALDLAFVADGRAELFWELNLNKWDTAAGVLLVEEAGGKVTDLAGRADYEAGRTILASNGRIHDGLLALVREAGYP